MQILFLVVSLLVTYAVVRLAASHGAYDALRRRDRERQQHSVGRLD